MVNLVDKELICVHPCMTVNPEIYKGSMYAEQRVSGKYDLSYEMVEFLANLSRGRVDWKSDTAQRCLKIATRKGCYPEPLLHPLGIPTASGEEAALDAKIVQGRIIRYCHTRGLDIPPVDQVKTMDEIIVYGNLTTPSIRMLEILWNLLPKTKKPIKDDVIAPTPYKWPIEVRELEGDKFALMSSIRNNMNIRKAVDCLIRFGLVDLANLPKHLEVNGKGRAPVGFYISDAGVRFYQNYLETYDPKAKFSAYMSAPPPEDVQEEKSSVSPEDAYSPDVVDGENLRELFG